MRSYPLVVSFSQLGELSSSFGVSEPRYTLEVIYSTHIGSLEVEALVNFTYFNLVLPKVEHLCASYEL